MKKEGNILIFDRKQYSLVSKVDEKLLRRGGYAKVNIFGIKDIEKAKDFINK